MKKHNALEGRPKKLQIKSEDFVMPFGKHKHRTVELILDTDPSYIIWLSDEKIANISQEIYNKAQELENNNLWDEIDGGYLNDEPPY